MKIVPAGLEPGMVFAVYALRSTDGPTTYHFDRDLMLGKWPSRAIAMYCVGVYSAAYFADSGQPRWYIGFARHDEYPDGRMLHAAYTYLTCLLYTSPSPRDS